MVFHVLFGTSRRESEREPLSIHCPGCGAREAPALAWETTDRLLLIHLIPILRLRTIFVRCSACKKELVAKCSLKELLTCNAATRELLLVESVSFVARVCALLGLLLFWAPMIGIIPAVIAFCMTRRQRNWAAKASVIALILSGLVTLAMVCLILLLGPPR